MTPSQYIEAKAETIWKLIGQASGKLVIALVRRRLGLGTLRAVAKALNEAADEADGLVEYVERIKGEL